MALEEAVASWPERARLALQCLVARFGPVPDDRLLRRAHAGTVRESLGASTAASVGLILLRRGVADIPAVLPGRATVGEIDSALRALCGLTAVAADTARENREAEDQ